MSVVIRTKEASPAVRCIVAFLFLGFISHAKSDALFVMNTEPFQTSNRNSYIRNLGLPTAETAQWFEKSSSRFSLTSELSSQFFVDDTGQQKALFDGETTTVTLRYRHTLSDKIEWGIDLPYIWQDGGGLDSFVEGWHRTFGLPNAGREEFDRNQIHYSVTGTSEDDGNAVLTSHAHGVADMALSMRWRLTSDQTRDDVALMIKIEAPTGDVQRFTGSDSWDAALGLTAYSANWFSALGASFNGNVGVLLPGDSDQLSLAMKSHVLYGSAMLAWPFIWEGVTLKMQLEAHTAFYESTIKPLGESSWQLSFGAGFALSSRWSLDLGMSEDISPETAPDFTLLATLSYR